MADVFIFGDETGIAPTPPKKHTCSVCQKTEEWGPKWAWYGSYRDLDDGVPVLKFCSPACAGQMPEVKAAMDLAAANEAGDKLAAELAEIESEEAALKAQLRDLAQRKRQAKRPRASTNAIRKE